MSELGSWLRQAREAKRLSLEDVERETRIRAQFLAALEEEDFSKLPGDVYARGFLRNYARFLGLDPQEALQRYKALLAQPNNAEMGSAARLSLDEPVEVPLMEPARSPARAVAVILLVIALAAVGWWYFATIGRDNLPPFLSGILTPIGAQPSPTMQAVLGTSTQEALGTPPAEASPVPSPTSTPSPPPSPTSTQTPTPTPKVYRGVEVQVEIIAASWMQVTVDGVRVFVGTLEPGEKRTWEGQESVALRVGNAGGVRVTVNGEPLGLLGAVGEVKDVEWVRQGGPASVPVPTGAGPVAEQEGTPSPTVTATASSTPPPPAASPTAFATESAAMRPAGS